MPSSSRDVEVAQLSSHNETDAAPSDPSFDSFSDSESLPASPRNDTSIPLLEVSTDTHTPSRESSRAPPPWDDRIAHRSRLMSWLNGSPPFKILRVRPVFPIFEHRLRTISSSWIFGQSSVTACMLVILLWTVSFGILLTSAYKTFSSPSAEEPPMQLACNTRLWHSNTFCGLGGMNCAPFTGGSFTFRCPSECASVQVLEPHTIGNQEVIYQNMVIGGGSATRAQRLIYRGDSFICQAAIHAGVFSNNKGGCGTLTRVGEHSNFVASTSNGISSIGFLPAFPLAYTLSSTNHECTDPQWTLLAVSVVASVLVSLLATSSRIFTASTFVIVFFQVALASDRPFSPNTSSAISMALERLLPTTFLVYAIYQFCIRQTLGGLQANLERTLLWLGGCWVGALNNYTFDRMPISRLTPHDLQQQPGAVTALVVVIAVIFAAAVGQIFAFRAEGRLAKYLALYLIGGLALGILASAPDLRLRLHHYIIALLLLPGTSIQTRPSLLYQGLLFGLFLNGVARWGYASILQTAEALRQDGQLGSPLPEILPPDLINGSNIQFTIQKLAEGFDGISMLVNDVERYCEAPASLPLVFNWTRSSVGAPEFFRFAFTSFMPLGGIRHGDFTKAGTWHENGTWEEMQPGPSR